MIYSSTTFSFSSSDSDSDFQQRVSRNKQHKPINNDEEIIDLCSLSDSSDTRKHTSSPVHSHGTTCESFASRFPLNPEIDSSGYSECVTSDYSSSSQNSPDVQVVKTPNSFAANMMPVCDDRKLSPVDVYEGAKSKFSETERYASTKTSADRPEFSYEELLKVTIHCDEETTIKFCQQKGLIAESQVCENCNSVIPGPKLEAKRGQWYWRCNHKPAGKPPCNNFKFSIKKGTFFEKAHLGFHQILLLVWCFVKRFSQHQTKTFLDLSGKNNHTTVDWFSMCREVCDDWMIHCSEQIGGPGEVVEIDESYCAGRRKGKRGRRMGNDRKCKDSKGNPKGNPWGGYPWTLGGVMRGTKRCFLKRILGKRSREVMLPILKQFILPGTTIISDKWKAYIDLNIHLEECGMHYTVNHSKNFVDPDTGAHTQNIENLWHHMKLSFPPYGVKPEQLGSYLSKFVWERHVKEYKLDPFLFFLECASTTYIPATKK